MAKRKQKEPENVEWIVTGNVTLHQVCCIVHAKTRSEAIEKANALDNIGGIDFDAGEVVDCDFRAVQANVSDE